MELRKRAPRSLWQGAGGVAVLALGCRAYRLLWDGTRDLRAGRRSGSALEAWRFSWPEVRRTVWLLWPAQPSARGHQRARRKMTGKRTGDRRGNFRSWE